MMKKIKEIIRALLVLTIMPFVFVVEVFLMGAINNGGAWRVIVGLSFLLLAAINFALVLLLGN